MRPTLVPLVLLVVGAAFPARADGPHAAPKTSDKVVVERARVLKRPVFPSDARNQGVAGTVAVRVLVSPDGDVLSARAVAGPDALRGAAVAAARGWEFTSSDSPDTVTGFLVFKFTTGSQYASIVGVADEDTGDAKEAAAAPGSDASAAKESTPAAKPTAPAAAAQPAAAPSPSIRRVTDASLVASARRKVAPQYPAAARSARVEGPVVVEVQIDAAGRVTSARALSGPAMLRDAAVSAARQWSFAPQDAAGAKVTTVGTIAFNFKL